MQERDTTHDKVHGRFTVECVGRSGSPTRVVGGLDSDSCVSTHRHTPHGVQVVTVLRLGPDLGPVGTGRELVHSPLTWSRLCFQSFSTFTEGPCVRDRPGVSCTRIASVPAEVRPPPRVDRVVQHGPVVHSRDAAPQGPDDRHSLAGSILPPGP